MPIIEKVVEWLRGAAERVGVATSEAERLSTIRAEIDEIEAELSSLAEQRREQIVPNVAGEAAAVAAIADLDAAMDALRTRLADLRQAEAQTHAKVRAEQAAAADAELTRKRRRVAELRQELFAEAETIEASAGTLAVAMKATIAKLQELGTLTESPVLQRWNERAPVQIRNGLAPLFDIDPAGPKRAANNLLGLVSGWVGERAHWGVSRFFEEILDHEAALFATEEAAEACRERLVEAGRKAILMPGEDGLFAVVPLSSVFSSQAEAETALRAESTYRTYPHIVARWREDFVILPAGIARALPIAA